MQHFAESSSAMMTSEVTYTYIRFLFVKEVRTEKKIEFQSHFTKVPEGILAVMLRIELFEIPDIFIDILYCDNGRYNVVAFSNVIFQTLRKILFSNRCFCYYIGFDEIAGC